MSYLPCENSSCKSFGKPHPNCRCHGNMAEGGEASHFCSSNNMHDETCQYYADGTPDAAVGEVPPNDIPNTNEVPAEDIPESASPNLEAPLSDIPDNQITPQMKYSTPGQEIGAGLEGAAQGFAGPLATLAEKGLSKLGVPDLADEDINGREEANPNIHDLGEAAGLGTGLFTGTGEAGLIFKGVGKAAEFANLAEKAGIASKIGMGAVKGAIESGLLQGGDNISKALLGQGDPNESIAGVLADGLGPASMIGGAFGALGSAASKGLDALSNSNFGKSLHTMLSGIGETANGVSPENSLVRQIDPKAYDIGSKWWLAKVMGLGIGSSAAAYNDIKQGYQNDDTLGGFVNAAKDLGIGAALGFGTKALSKPAAAVLLKAISNGESNPRSLFQLMNYANDAASGAQKITKGVENLFKSGSQKLSDKYDFESGREKLGQYIDNGGISQNIDQSVQDQNSQPAPQGFAEGGEVKSKKPAQKVPGILQDNDPIAHHLPEQNMLLTTAKGRISNYLSSIKPSPPHGTFAFDAAPDQTQQKKSYNRALDIANHPLSILDEIKQGTIEPEHLKHFNSMYPDLGRSLQQAVTKRISEAQLNGEKPSFHIRQGMSMLMGTPLSSELTPQNIQAAQAVFQMQSSSQQPQGSPPTKSKKGTAPLSKSSQSFLTGNQSLASRQQKQ
jgi:hypothetical protein